MRSPGRQTRRNTKWQESEKIITSDLGETDGAELCGGVTKADKICSWQNGYKEESSIGFG